MTQSKLKRATAFALTAAALLATACNTVQGVGQDLESAGEKAGEITKKKN